MPSRTQPIQRSPAVPRFALLAGAVATAGLGLAAASAAAASTSTGEACVPVGAWRIAGGSGLEAATAEEIVRRAVQAGVVLLGESHESEEHHRWQLQTLAALHARQPDLVIALEMLPRRAQPALDRWVAGQLDEVQLAHESGWRRAGGFEPALYLPILHFARMNRIPLVAVNVDRDVIRAVAEGGVAAVPEAERRGIGNPSPARPAYEDMLFDRWREHPTPDGARRSTSRADREFRHFVEAQLVWDRAMAQGIAEAATQHAGALVVALMGSGHVMYGWGVPQQLQALGGPAPLKLLPFDPDGDCTELSAGLADGVFGVAPPPQVPVVPRPRLGVTLGPTAAGVGIVAVAKDSIAERAGLRAGDLIVSVAGRPATRTADVAAAVMRQAPGTWLPLEVQRGQKTLEIIARFPPEPES